MTAVEARRTACDWSERSVDHGQPAAAQAVVRSPLGDFAVLRLSTAEQFPLLARAIIAVYENGAELPSAWAGRELTAPVTAAESRGRARPTTSTAAGWAGGVNRRHTMHYLTTDHAASSHGQPVLIIDGRVYGPCDVVDHILVESEDYDYTGGSILDGPDAVLVPRTARHYVVAHGDFDADPHRPAYTGCSPVGPGYP